MSRIRYLLKRSLVSVVLIFVSISILFLLFRSLPGDITVLFTQQGASQEAIARIEEKWGLNEPLYIQYFNYITNMLSGDVGTSLNYGEDVWQLTKWRLLNSFVLVGPAITAAYICGAIFGGVLGNNRGSKLERWGVVGVIFMGALPAFFTGILLIVVFGEILNLFPISGMVSTETTRMLGRSVENVTPIDMYQTTDFWWHYVLPFTTIFMRYLYVPTLIMRTNVVEIFNEGFMNYHRLTGISPRSEIRKLMKHSSLPVITLYPVSMTRAIGGVVLVEVVFNWPGIGDLLVGAVLARDYPVIQFVFFLVVVWVVFANFVVDIFYGLIDPRMSIDGD
jgi:peptide/nickel transport system permease protein